MKSVYMDKWTARRLLGLPEVFTDKELKAAYAAGAKEHHPEDDPDAFLRIQEAYLCLQELAAPSSSGTENAGAGQGSPWAGQEFPGAEETPAEDSDGSEYAYEEYEFERAINEAEHKRQGYEKGIDLALQELDGDDAFLKADVMERILDGLTNEQLEDPRFQAGLLSKMKASFLKRKVYPYNRTKSLSCRASVMDAVIRRYGFRRVQPGTLAPQAEELRTFLDKARGLDARRREWKNAVFSVFLIMAGAVWFLVMEGYPGPDLWVGIFSGGFLAFIYAALYLTVGRDFGPGAGSFMSFLGAMFLWAALAMVGSAGIARSEAGLAPIMGLTLWMMVYPVVQILSRIIKKIRKSKRERKNG